MPFVPVLFSKYHKSTKDLLDNKKYDLQKTLVLKTLTRSGVTLTSSAKLKGEDAVGKLEAEWMQNKVGSFDALVDTKDLLELTYKSVALADGFTVEVAAKHDMSSRKEHLCNMSVEGKYLRENFAGTGMINFLNPPAGSQQPVDVEVSGTMSVGADGLCVGAEVLYGDNDFKQINGGLTYTKDDATLGCKTAKKGEEVIFSYFHKVRPNLNAGANFTVKMNKTKGDADFGDIDLQKGFGFGIERQLDSSSSVKGKLDKSVGSGDLTLSSVYSTEINASSRLSLSSILDVRNLDGGNHKFGFKLELGELH